MLQDEVDHKDDADEEHVDLVSKAEEDFFECVEMEKKRRERESSKKDQEPNDEDEKQDKGKVRFSFLCTSNFVGSHLAIDICLSVRPSVRLSVKRLHPDKTK